MKSKQIREVGCYELVYYDSNDNRIQEIVLNTSHYEAKKQAETQLIDGHSYTLSRIIDNSKFNTWTPNKRKNND